VRDAIVVAGILWRALLAVIRCTLIGAGILFGICAWCAFGPRPRSD
jgi:hypothetical protein